MTARFASRSAPRKSRDAAVTAACMRGEGVALIIGIDPGSRKTGYGLVEQNGSRINYVHSGVIKVRGGTPKPERLLTIKKHLDGVLRKYRPSAFAVEEIFVSKNIRSILVLGEARGVIILAAAEAGIPVFEYSAREIKRSVVGAGAAHKSQVASMIRRLLAIDHEPSP